MNIFTRISSDFQFDKRNAVTTMPFHSASVETNPKDYPLSSGAELTDGLQFLMYDQNRRDLASCRDASFTIHPPFELPNAFDSSNYVAFDYQKVLTILITPEVVFTDSSLQSVEPKKRNCYFDGEKDLKYFKTYSKNNCEMECFSDFAQQNCNCTTLNLVRNESTPLCHLKDMACIRYRGTPRGLRHCGCLEGCNSINYRFEIRSDKFSKKHNPKYIVLISTKSASLNFFFQFNRRSFFAIQIQRKRVHANFPSPTIHHHRVSGAIWRLAWFVCRRIFSVSRRDLLFLHFETIREHLATF